MPIEPLYSIISMVSRALSKGLRVLCNYNPRSEKLLCHS